MRKISPIKRGKELVFSSLKDRIRASLIAQLIKNLPAMQFDSWVGKICWKRDRLPTPVFLDFPCGSAGK